jgi:5'-nucleotidase (lipoprotein e(P4) family)
MGSRYRRAVKGVPGLLAVAVFAGCAAWGVGTPDRQSGPRAHEELNAVLWVQTSAEYEFACRQSYRLATGMLDAAIQDLQWTAAPEQGSGYDELPPAVILDVDETVLDNSAFEARVVLKNESFNLDMWDEWVAEADAPAVPGSQEFLSHALERGVAVFFVTNRTYRDEPQTVRNLQREFGTWISAQNVLTKYEQPDWTSDKTSRRAYLAQSHRILLLIGDDFNDFANLGDVVPSERVRLAQGYSDYWGTAWILLPNPMYGSWEQALYGYDRNIADAAVLDLKYSGLDPGD